MAKANSSNALMGARARIATVEAQLRNTEAKLVNASDSCALYAKIADILKNGSERLKQSITQLSDVINEQAQEITAFDLRVKNDANRMKALKDKLTHSYILVGGLLALVLVDVGLSIMGF